jgi:sec-independent protein translocase protein TatC
MYIAISFLCSLLISSYKTTQLVYLFISSCYIKNSLELKISFIFTDVREAFSATLLICLVFSLFTLSFFVTYSFVCFFLPCWFAYERVSKVIVVCVLFFSCVTYILWIHMFIIPKVCDFFFTFQVQNIDCFSLIVEPRIYSYVVWGVWFLVLASFFFVLVCFLLFLVTKGKIALSYWSRNRKSRVFGSVLLAALISPPELFTQLPLSFGLFVLFEVIVFFAFLYSVFVNKKTTNQLII